MPGSKQSSMLCPAAFCSPHRATRQPDDEASSNFVLPVRWWWGSGCHSDPISTTRSHYKEWPLETEPLVQQRDTDTLATDPLKHGERDPVSKHSVRGLFRSLRFSTDHTTPAHFHVLSEHLVPYVLRRDFFNAICWLLKSKQRVCFVLGVWHCDPRFMSCTYIPVPPSGANRVNRISALSKTQNSSFHDSSN